jgi:2'-5' RNA ligase
MGESGGPGGRRAFRRRFDSPRDDPPGTSRLFVALPLAGGVRDAMADLMRELAGGPIEVRSPGQPRWVGVEGLHLTLRFLGATPDARIPDLTGAIAAAASGVEPFRIELGGGGAFPSVNRPRVLWIGVRAGAPDLAELASRLNVELAPLGWPADDRPFQAHLTLARTDGVAGSDQRARRLVELARDMREGWQAGEVVLYRSHGGRGPSRYEDLARAPLGADSAPGV